MPRTRNEFVEIVTVEERYLIITHVKNKESKRGRNFFVPSLQYSQFGQDGRENRTFSGI